MTETKIMQVIEFKNCQVPKTVYFWYPKSLSSSELSMTVELSIGRRYIYPNDNNNTIIMMLKSETMSLLRNNNINLQQISGKIP